MSSWGQHQRKLGAADAKLRRKADGIPLFAGLDGSLHEAQRNYGLTLDGAAGIESMHAGAHLLPIQKSAFSACGSGATP